MKINLNIANDPTPKSEIEVNVDFWLIKNIDGTVSVVAKSSARCESTKILTIKKNGTLMRHVFRESTEKPSDWMCEEITNQNWLVIKVVDEIWPFSNKTANYNE